MKLKYTTRLPMTAIHILIWAIIFCLPLFMWSSGSEEFSWSRYLRFSFVPVLFMVIFYLNYFVLVDKLLFRRKTAAYILCNVGLIALAIVALYLWQQLHFAPSMEGGMNPPPPDGVGGRAPRPGFGGPGFGGPRPGPEGRRPLISMILLRDGTMLALTAGVALAIRMTLQWFKTEQEKQTLEAARAEAELKNLKNQLNPHFLFNTLNNIYSLIEFDPGKARYAVESLSRMLRHVLYDHEREMVPLEREFEFMKSYIELMALRLTPSTALQVDIPEKGNGLMIAPLLFINSIENAFKHGISTKKLSFIRIAVRIKDGSVECVVENSYFPRNNDQMGSGIGQENLMKRLELIYPERYELINERRENTYYSKIAIYI